MTFRNLCLFSLLILTISLLIAGCATTTTSTILTDDFDVELLKKMKTWEGLHISQLIQRTGLPTYKTSDEAGGIIYVWQIDPASLPSLRVYPPLYAPSTQVPARSMISAIAQSTSIFLHQETVRKRIQSRNQSMEVRQKILAMKRMFYVRSDGTIYLTRLMYL